MKKLKVSIACVLVCMLSGCAKVVPYLESLIPVPEHTKTEENSTDETAAAEETTAVQTDEEKRQSINPDTVTGYDREAVTLLINQDMTNKYGASGHSTLSSGNLSFSKSGGVLTVVGTVTYTEPGTYYSQTVPFEYVYEDHNVEYVLVSTTMNADVDVSSVPSATTAVNATLEGTFDITIGSSVTVTATHSGTGAFIVTMADSSGNETEVFNESGDYSGLSKTTQLPGGSYQLRYYTTGGSYSFNFSST